MSTTDKLDERSSAPVGAEPGSKVTHDEDTLRKVYEALLENGIYGQKALDVVSAMQNEGILFREVKPGVR